MHTPTLVPTAALAVPAGQLMATALLLNVAAGAVKLLIVVGVTSVSGPTYPGQNVLALVQLPMSLTLVCHVDPFTAYPGAIALQFLNDVNPPDAAFVSPAGQLRGTALDE